MLPRLRSVLACLAASICVASGQTFTRLGTCPDLGCVLPPDQQDFHPGQQFDIRFEIHAPINGSEAFNNGVPDEKFTATIYEDLFAQDANTPSVVNVASKIYRRIALYEPGTYTVTLSYYSGKKTTAQWTVRPLANKKKAKNVIFFIGDGMTIAIITAARLLAHKTVNGRYQSLMALDKFPVLGHQMTHSVDNFMTDSANSANALYTGHKSSLYAMGVYADSSPDDFDDSKVETIVELLTRILAVTTAALNGISNYSWTKIDGPDVYFGGGADFFLPGATSYLGKDYYEEFEKKGYSISLNKTALATASDRSKALGVFCKYDMPVWLDRNIFPENLGKRNNDPSRAKTFAKDLPGLKEMTLKAIDVLHNRGGKKGFFLMSEAASIDKQMHALDYDRALGDLLELDDTIQATIEKLKKMGILQDTLIVVFADHGHGFGSDDPRQKRNAIGVYEKAGLSQYVTPQPGVSYNTGPNFPLNWDPRYVLAAGVGGSTDYYFNPTDKPHGFVVNGTLPTDQYAGVHSLTDVPVYAMGPCQEVFRGTYDNIDLFYKLANCLGLAHGTNRTDGYRS
ncbi:alkaline-phosphatase-like protein [Cercophora newfieldiana]|uniref:alkaline phosphatase n=1 Tax=Cercophora newfieldiana TaxID=92897 RepID=A0AA39YHG9_9PEZI|nr:alkaline-phosphatase-like protein [Cercophora newfieldiana]